MGKTVIIDYGAGNLMSVTNALKYLGQESVITSDTAEIERADRIILPGVGAFPPAIKMIRDQGLEDVIKAQTVRKPFLGICLGMQMLFDCSYEFGYCKGLGFIPGEVKELKGYIKDGLDIPHMGWNSLTVTDRDGIMKKTNEGDYVYFVHSFAAFTEEKYVSSFTDYGGRITASVQNKNVYGTQFHPEKSGETGLQILKEFSHL
jgi:glutamine amidotransferase